MKKFILTKKQMVCLDNVINVAKFDGGFDCDIDITYNNGTTVKMRFNQATEEIRDETFNKIVNALREGVEEI